MFKKTCVTSISHKLFIFSTLVSYTLEGHDPSVYCILIIESITESISSLRVLTTHYLSTGNNSALVFFLLHLIYFFVFDIALMNLNAGFFLQQYASEDSNFVIITGPNMVC